MTSLVFLFLIIGIFVLTFLSEADSLREFSHKPAGLFHWFTSGNWPAKVGALLMIIGFGALLRYLMITIELPPPYKIAMGIASFAILTGMSVWMRNRPKQRAIYLALAGAAAGVAYLTAYSVYTCFGYINSVQSLGLLFLVAVASTIFAVSANTMSVAILAMIGAFLAPAFAYYDTPAASPQVVYSYYLAVSLLCLVMSYMRGWRPLIHLSFLFTLAGGLFFAWTCAFYLPEHHAVMLPFLLALIAIHLAMPLLENHAAGSKWMGSFDRGYFFLLPMVSIVLVLSISPDSYRGGWNDVLALSALWFAASIFEYFMQREQALHYAGVALVYFLIAMLLALLTLHFENRPQIFYLGILVAAFVYTLWLIRMPASSLITISLNVLVILSGLYVAGLTWSEWMLWCIMIAGQIIFSLMAFFSDKHGHNGKTCANITRSFLPFILFPWALAVANTMQGPADYITACFVAGSALFASIQAQIFCSKERLWPNTLSPAGFILFGGGLLYTTLLHIERGFWPVMLDILLLAYVGLSCRWMLVNKNKDRAFFVLFGLVTSVTFTQSLFLRIFGPDEQTSMSIMDLSAMYLPALVSLWWVIIGTSFCVYSQRIQSRILWSLGALLLAIATIKLVIFDFGSLDQLGNIIAMILSGAVFMGLAWFVPIPPGVKKSVVTHERDSRAFSGLRQLFWVVMIISILFLLHHCGSTPVEYGYQSLIKQDF